MIRFRWNRLKHIKIRTEGCSEKRSFRKFITIIACLCLFVAAFAVIFINNNYVQSIKKLVRSTTTANISELTVVKSQYLDEKLNMNSKLYNYWLLILGKETGFFLARN